MNSKEANQQRTITKSRFGDQVDSGRVAPLITTIIPTYRRPAMLRRAIKSVLDQTYPNFKVCVYDNASGDETAEVVAEFAREDTRVQYHCHKENIGAVKNFCYGLNEIDTPYYSILSDDDVLLPLFYETVMADFKKYPDAFFAITGTIRMDIDGTVLGVPILKWQPGFYEPPNGLYEMLSKSHLFETPRFNVRFCKSKVAALLV
jgi:glycosyltransferase involved in cell wall biosynthesis